MTPRPFAHAWALLALLSLGGTILACQRAEVRGDASPPLPPAGSQLEPRVAEIIERAAKQAGERPRQPQVWIELGLAYRAHHLFALAVASLDRAVELAPESQRARYLRALSRLDAGDVTGALGDLELVIEGPELHVPAHWRLGLLLLERNRIEAADRVFGRLRDLAPEAAAGRIGAARVALAQGDAARAAELLEDQLARPEQPSRGYAQRLLGTAYQRLGRGDDARVAFARSDGAGMELDDAWLAEERRFRASFSGRLGEAQGLMRRNPTAALALLAELERERPGDVTVISDKCTAFLMLGGHAEGLTQCQRALELKPEHYGAQLNASVALIELAAQAPSTEEAFEFATRALEHVDRALELNPSLARASAQRGRVLSALGQLPEAVAMFKAAYAASEAGVVWLYEAARLEWRLGLPESIETLERVLAVEPQNAEAWYLLGVAHEHLGRDEEARRALQRAAELEPGNPAVAQALRDLGSAGQR